MPHIEISCFPGRTEEQKNKLTEAIIKDMIEIFNAKEESLSIAIKEIEPDNWKEVYKEKIEGNNDLYKKPGYTVE